MEFRSTSLDVFGCSSEGLEERILDYGLGGLCTSHGSVSH